MDNIQDRVDNWRKKIEGKKDKNEKLSEKEAKIILNEAIDISSGLVEDIINDCKLFLPEAPVPHCTMGI